MKYLFFIYLQIIALNICAQQKAMFSQYMFNPVLINPAYPAVDESLNITHIPPWAARTPLLVLQRSEIRLARQ
jgi:hypothetical protein